MTSKTFVLLCSLLSHSVSIAKAQVVGGEEKELILPIVVQGPIDQNRFFQTNIHGLSADFPDEWCLEGFSNAGGVLEVGCLFTPTQRKCQIGRRTSDNPFYHADLGTCRLKFPSLQDGWARLTFTDSESFQVSSEVMLKTDRGMLTVASVPAVSPTREFFAPALKFSSATTAHAVVNPSPSETALVQVQLTQFRPDGTEFSCRTELSIPPRNRASKFLDELLHPCQLPPDFHDGILRITSNLPIAVATLKVILPETFLVNLPIERVK